MSTEQLVRMANDIAANFASEPDHARAVEQVAGHIRRFWDPRMRRKLQAHADRGGADLAPLVREALGTLS